MSRRVSRRVKGQQYRLRRCRTLRPERLEDRRLLTGAGPSDGDFWPQLTVDRQAYDPSGLLVRFRTDAVASSDQTPLPFAAIDDIGSSLLPGLSKVLLPAGFTVDRMIEVLDGFDAIEYAEPVYQVHLEATPDDPRFGELWGMQNEGQTGGTYDADIDAPEAWDVTVGSGSTIVAVIDTGVDYNHEDLAGNMWVNAGEIPNDGLDNDGNGFVDDVHGYDFVNNDGNPLDDQGHGTHVAGTIAAVGNNGIGVTGVNWNAQIMALKFLNAQGSGDTDDAIRALNYAVANGATISNNSWGFTDGFSQALYDAIRAARGADHVFVAAAGNGNFLGFGVNNDATPFYPASYDLENIISVAAVDKNDAKPLFSNYGATTVDLAAPGVDILSTVRNNGYGLNTGTSMASPHVAGAVALVRDLHPDWGYAQVVNQVLQSVDPVNSMEGITTTGGRLNVAAAVGAEIVPAPEIQVALGLHDVSDDVGVVDFENTPPGLPIDYTFTVKNRGMLPLQLTEPISVPAGFSLASSFGTTTLPVGASTTFTIRLDGLVEGTYNGEVSFANDDPDENPFNFTVTGSVAVPPAIQILDDGDADFTTSGTWNLWSGQGYQNDIHEAYAGTGQSQANWTFDRLLPGAYRVAATWTTYTNRATDAPFTILDETTPLQTVLVNQRLKPVGFFEDGVYWQYLDGPYDIAGHTLSVVLSDDADGRLNADAVRIERIDLTPEIAVTEYGLGIADDTGLVDFGATTLGKSLSRTFTVQNLGAEPLTLDSAIQVPIGFELVTGFGTTTLATDETTSFAIALAAKSTGEFTGTVSFGNNDPDESPFNFTVQGVVEEPPPVQIVDNGDPAFATVGAWTRWTGQGYESDIHESYPGTGAKAASWSFTNLMPGYYRVAATWTAHSNRATNAPFRVNGDDLGSIIYVNQQVAPSGFSDAGVKWNTLATPLLVTGGVITVDLSDAANGRLNADAIRIERLPPFPEIEISDGNLNLLAGLSTFDFGSTPPGIPTTHVFTVHNAGAGTLALDAPVIVSPGFSLAADLGSTALEPGESTTFAVRFDALTEGAATGEVSLGSNDADEDPFRFTIRGDATMPPAVQIIDNGDAGFAAVGEWSRWTGQGYENDIHESLPGIGADVASWAFTGLVPGTYRVAATWSVYTNRATNAPFTILDAATPLTTDYVNQKLAPVGFSDAGGNWQQLGDEVEITSGKLTVQLHDSADGRLNADAIRIERIDPAPEIQVRQDMLDLVDGTSLVDFGSTTLGAPSTRTFTVTNAGGAPLLLSEPIDLPAGFSLVTGPSTTELAIGASTTFVVQLDAVAPGTFAGLISIGNNDADENPFRITIQGTVLMPPSVVILDNGSAGFTTVGEWRRWTGQGYENDIHESYAGSGADVATWSFAHLLPGEYRVSATWTAHLNRATNAPYTVLDGATSLMTIQVNQRSAPNQFTDAGVVWNDLGTTYQVHSDTLVVRLTDAANGRVNADAIRIERVGSLAGAASFGGNNGKAKSDTYATGLADPIVPSRGSSLETKRPSAISPAPQRPVLRGPAFGQLDASFVGPSSLDQTRTLRDSLFAAWPARLICMEDLLEDLNNDRVLLE